MKKLVGRSSSWKSEDSLNGRVTQWILVGVAVIAMMGSALAWTMSTFATKEEVRLRFSILEAKIDRLLDRVEK